MESGEYERCPDDDRGVRKIESTRLIAAIGSAALMVTAVLLLFGLALPARLGALGSMLCWVYYAPLVAASLIVAKPKPPNGPIARALHARISSRYDDRETVLLSAMLAAPAWAQGADFKEIDAIYPEAYALYGFCPECGGRIGGRGREANCCCAASRVIVRWTGVRFGSGFSQFDTEAE